MAEALSKEEQERRKRVLAGHQFQAAAEQEDTLAGEAREGGTTLGRYRMKEPTKPAPPQKEGLAAVLARKKKQRMEKEKGGSARGENTQQNPAKY